jgi:hypothetical protein
MNYAHYPSNFDRYLSCFEASHCHLVPAPQGAPVPMMDGDQPTAAIKPQGFTGFQSIAMYPVDGDFIIFAFKDYSAAKQFALEVGEEYQKFGVPPVTTVQPDRINYIRDLVDLAYAAWRIASGEAYRDAAANKLSKMMTSDKRYADAKEGLERSLADKAKNLAKLGAAKERDRNLAYQAVKEATSPGMFGGMSTPSESHLFKAARSLGYTL